MRVSARAQFAGLVAGLVGMSFGAGMALAEQDPLDKAKASVAHALVALKAAKAPGAAPAFAAHRDKAVKLLTRAQGEILKAKSHASKPARASKPAHASKPTK